MTRQRQVFAYSGIIHPRPGERPTAALTGHALTLTGVVDRTPKVCYVPTAVGDSETAVRAKRAQFAEHRPDVELSVLTLFTQPSVADVRTHLLGQDLVLVEGGSVVNLMAVWQAHGLPDVLRECWTSGVVLAGPSAGSLCWHVGGPTDSFGDALAPFTSGLGLLPYSNSVHHDLSDQPRRRVYADLVGSGVLPDGYATDDGVGLHYVGDRLREAVTIRPGASATYVSRRADGGVDEQTIVPRLLPD